MGGLFLYTRTPPAAGSMVELIIDFAGGSIRARAIVRHSAPGKGMGIQFVQMAPENRAKLNQLLTKQAAKFTPEVASNTKADAKFGAKFDAPNDMPADDTSPTESSHFGSEGGIDFEAEIAQVLLTAKRSNYYQILGVASDSPAHVIKQRFYALARKFHPDHHMAQKDSLASLKELMGLFTTAYKTLTDLDKRAAYDARLERSGGFDLHRHKTQAQIVIEESLTRARECIRAGNFIGSIVWLRKCVEMAPGDAAHHTMLARSLGKVAQYRNEAIEHFKKAIELDAWKLDSYLQLAELYEEMELPSQALSVYTKILNIDPLHAKAREGYSKISSAPVASRTD